MSTPVNPTPPTATLLQLQDIGFAYPGVPVLGPFSAALQPGVTLVTGDEGGGKTTLLRLLAGELRPITGRIERHALDVFWHDPRQNDHPDWQPAQCFAAARQQHAGFDPALLEHLIQGLDLASHLDKSLYMLSTGTRRKVWLAAGLASGARLTLLDEPFAALDRASIRFLTELLSEASQHPTRAWVVADHSAPQGVPLTAQWVLRRPAG